MCNFPSWIVDDDGDAHWLTDKDIRDFHKGKDSPICWLDMVGHSAITKVFKVLGKHFETVNAKLPKALIIDIKAGRMNQMMKAANISEMKFQKCGWISFIGFTDGDKFWYRNGMYHRSDGPAVEEADGSKLWYRNGKLHRDDGPAVECADGSKKWYRNGELHRDDGPAVEYIDGYKSWYRKGKLHRDDGPAVERVDGTKDWYRNGKLI